MSLVNLFLDKLTTIKRGFYTFKISSIMTIVLTMLVLLVQNSIFKEDSYIISLGIVVLLSIPLFIAVKLFKDDIKLYLIVIVFLMGYYFFELMNDYNIDYKALKYLFIFVAFFIAIIWSRFIRGGTNQEIWNWNIHVFKAFFGSLGIGLAIMIGLFLALSSIHMLFSVDIGDKIYANSATLIFVWFSTQLFISSLTLDDKSIVKEYNIFEELFGKYLLVGFSIVYFCILFVYDLKILFTHEMPKGVIAWLSIGFSLVAILTYLYLTPYKSDKKRYIWIAIFLQTFMLFYAIYIRVQQHGITLNRYYVILFGIWLFMISSYFLIKKNGSYRWIFISISLFLILSQYGYLSAYEVTKRSQQSIIKELLEKHSPITKKSDDKIKRKIVSSYRYLKMHFGESVALSQFKEKRLPDALIGFDENKRDRFFSLSLKDTSKDIRGYDYLDNFYLSNIRDIDDKKLKYSLVMRFENNTLFIYHKKTPLFKRDILKFVEGLKSNLIEDEKEMTIFFLNDKYGLKIIFRSINLQKNGKYIEGDVYIKKRDGF